MWTTLFLAFNGLAYVALGAWCTLAPAKTAAAIGFGLTNNSARSEYLTVYGGLEVGMGLFFLLCAWRAELGEAGLWFAALSYGALAAYRLTTLFTLSDFSAFIYTVAVFEPVMAVLSALLLWRHIAASA